MPNIAINATVLTPKSGGILVYIQNLIDRLLLDPEEFDVYYFFSNHFLKYFPEYTQSDKVIGLNLSGENPRKRILTDPLKWPGILKKYRIDAFHSPISYIPFGVHVPAVATIHDLRSFHVRENYSLLRGAFLRQMIRRTARKAAKIIAISDYTRNDLIETLGVPEEKVVRIYEGFDAAPFQVTYTGQQLRGIREKYNLPEKYLLSVGHLEPRKNFIRLIQAFNMAIRENKIPHKLVIVGKENYRYQQFYEILAKLNLQKMVQFTGFVAQEDLPAIYQQASVFILPTLFEGFGFPPLESMAAETPVISSNVTSLPEICGNAALFFNPYDEKELVEKIVTLINDQKLQKNLINKGLQNINRFNWERCTMETVKVYREIL